MLNWGIIGAGSIAAVFCNGMRFSSTGQVVAVASRSKGRADKLANDFAIPGRFTSYEAMLADDSVEAVYISTIHPFHAEWAIKAAEAGKHMLVEKPIAMNYREAAAIIAAAQSNDVFLMEAFMYRCHPQIQKAIDLLAEGAIGDVRLIRATFSYHAPYDPTRRTYSNELGGGGILDVGCYPASMVRLLAGAAAGKPFLEPSEIKGTGRVGPTGVDHSATAVLKFDSGIIAEMTTGVDCSIPEDVSVYGSKGTLTIPNPWLPSSPCRTAAEPLPFDTTFPPSTIILHAHQDQQVKEIGVTVDRDLFTYEADMVANHIDRRQAPAMSWEDSLGNMRLLDRWREEVGVTYVQLEA